MKKKLATAYKEHPLMITLRTAKGNPRVLMLLEPLWGIPFTLIAPYATLYMQAMGISDVQIGILIAVGAFTQVIFAFSGGILTDKYGRKRIANLGDILGWTIPCLIWAFSQDFWWFFIAINLNSFEQVNQTAWVCLLVEDADQNQMVHIWNWVFIAASLSVFFAPISGFFVGKTSVVPVLRVLYIIFAISMFIKVLITAKYTKETKQGRLRKKATANQSIWEITKGYRNVLTLIKNDKDTLLTLGVMVAMACTNLISTTFFSLYATANLHIAESTLSLFPIARTTIIILSIFLIPKVLDTLPFKIPMLLGFTIYIGCQLLLIFCPPGNLFLLFIYIFLDAFAFSMVSPRKEAMLARYLDINERARILSLLVSISYMVTIPVGYLSGLLSGMNRQYPFFLCLGFYIAIVAVLTVVSPGKVKTQTSRTD